MAHFSSKKEEAEHESLSSQQDGVEQESLQIPSDDPPVYDSAPPGYSSGSRSSVSSSSSEGSFIFHKKNISNMQISTSAGPILFVSTQGSWVNGQLSSNIKIHKGTESNSPLAATVKISTKEGTILMDVVGSNIGTTALQETSPSSRGCMFAMSVHGHGEVMVWHALRSNGSTLAWHLVRGDTGELMMEYKRAGVNLHRKMGEATWTADAQDLGITVGDNSMWILTSLVGALVHENVIDSMIKPMTRKEAQQLALGYSMAGM